MPKKSNTPKRKRLTKQARFNTDTNQHDKGFTKTY